MRATNQFKYKVKLISVLHDYYEQFVTTYKFLVKILNPNLIEDQMPSIDFDLLEAFYQMTDHPPDVEA